MADTMRLVAVESPYAPPPGSAYPEAETAMNETYARAALADCLARGEAPIASHLLYTQAGVLDDGVPGQRALGIEAGLVWARFAAATVAYVDRGISPGMRAAMDRAEIEGRAVEFRWIGGWS